MPYGYVQFDTADFLLTPFRLLSDHHYIIDSKKAFLTPTFFTIPFLLHIPALLFIPIAQHFLGLLDGDGEVGKKLDFLLQEMNREANTLLSKTSGLAGEALKITEAGLIMKAEIEKSREQVQNLE